MQKISPCIWMDNEAEEAANFYVSVFNGSPNKKEESKILETAYYNVETPSDKPVGSVLTVSFLLDGSEFMILNGGKFFKLSEAVSFIVNCKDQAEIDYFWENLSANPESEQCGWCKDKFGLSWQIVPENMADLVKTEKGMKLMMDMKKIDVKALEEVS